MQQLPNDFASFLHQNVCDSLILCGDNGDNQSFNIFFNHDDNITTRLGPLWNKFCQTNLFQSGCRIRFKFSIINSYYCHVFRI